MIKVKITAQFIAPVLLLLLLVSANAFGQNNNSEDYPSYKPPFSDPPPRDRISGATRGRGKAKSMLIALAPKHTGLTTVTQPSLYWSLSENAAQPLEFTLVDSQSPLRPLLELRITANRGIQGVDLAQYNVTLQPGLEYEWSVAVTTNRNQRAAAQGLIQYKTAPAHLINALRNANLADAVLLYAENGYWYDAITSVSRLIAVQPDNPRWQDWRMALLRQAGVTR